MEKQEVAEYVSGSSGQECQTIRERQMLEVREMILGVDEKTLLTFQRMF